MTAFFTSVPLAITPLTPVHVGCGEDFEPTNYVIDDGVLYHFDPTRAELSPEDARTLVAEASRPKGDDALLGIQRFFHSRRARFIGIANGALPVCTGVAEQYAQRIGKAAQRETAGVRINQLIIERTVHDAGSGAPYLPGSSLKGALRTAWLDALNGGRSNRDQSKAQDIERALLGHARGFECDPFRLLAIGDARGEMVESEVVFATNHKKKLVRDRAGREQFAKGPESRREVIRGGQFRAFGCEVRIHGLPGVRDNREVPAQQRRIPDLRTLAHACNRFYAPRLRASLQLLESRGLAAADWLQGVHELLDALSARLESGELMLLRIGRHAGAESVTLDGVRRIKISPPHVKPPKFSAEGAATIWLAAPRANARSGLQPFGWVLVERAAAAPAPGLEAWCTAQPRLDTTAIATRLAAARAEAREAAARLHAERVARSEQEVAERLAEAERQRRREGASEQARLVMDFVEACESMLAEGRRDSFNPGSGLYGRANSLSRQALAEGSPWTAEERAELADACERYLPEVLQGWDAKAARKKLRIAALRGSTA